MSNHGTPSSFFKEIAYQFLEHLAEFLEHRFDDCDIEYHQGMLTITLPSDRVFIVHWHEASAQLWLASPFSGAWTFSYDTLTQNWYSSKDNQALQTLLESELLHLKS